MKFITNRRRRRQVNQNFLHTPTTNLLQLLIFHIQTTTSDLSCSNGSSTSTSDLCKHIDRCTNILTKLITTFCRDVHTCISPAPIDPTSMKRFYNGVTRTHTPSPAIFSSDTSTSKAATYLNSKKLDNSSTVLSKINGAFVDTSPRPSKTALMVSPGRFPPPPSLFICGMGELKNQTHCLICPYTRSRIPDIRLQDIIFTKVDTRPEEYKCLGTGVTSTVFEGRVVINNCFKSVAIKLFKEPFDNLEGISAEAGLLKMLETTGITPKLFGILQRTSEGNHPGIVQELVQNSITLYQLIVGQPHCITKQKWYNIAYQLAFGLKSINEKGILINDLKSDNILVNINTDECRLTFIDMGHASYMHGKRFPMTTEEAIIYNHLAPEIKHGEETSESSEVFALGWIFKNIPLQELSFISHKCLSSIPLLRPSVYDILNFVEEIM
ncbi:probable serine/threonine-protein kinase DDB_G0272092 [Mytilus edulis]|uniref:probable serine/threonine-protein kinase DDB_G0272092 n=1 Tax=Mytilus edulis TaxID=6550 RepID=UPI0039F0173D